MRLSNLRAGLLIDTGGIGPATTVHYAVVAGPVFTFDAPISLELLAEVGGTEFSRMGDEHASVPGMMPSVGLRTFLALRYGADDEGSIGIFMSVREELTRANVELQQYNNFHEANGQVDIYRMGGRSIEFGLQFGWDFRLQQD